MLRIRWKVTRADIGAVEGETADFADETQARRFAAANPPLADIVGIVDRNGRMIPAKDAKVAPDPPGRAPEPEQPPVKGTPARGNRAMRSPRVG